MRLNVLSWISRVSAILVCVTEQPKNFSTHARRFGCDDLQAYTVCGTFVGNVKKELDLTIVADKAQGGELVCQIA